MIATDLSSLSGLVQLLRARLHPNRFALVVALLLHWHKLFNTVGNRMDNKAVATCAFGALFGGCDVKLVPLLDLLVTDAHDLFDSSVSGPLCLLQKQVIELELKYNTSNGQCTKLHGVVRELRQAASLHAVQLDKADGQLTDALAAHSLGVSALRGALEAKQVELVAVKSDCTVRVAELKQEAAIISRSCESQGLSDTLHLFRASKQRSALHAIEKAIEVTAALKLLQFVMCWHHKVSDDAQAAAANAAIEQKGTRAADEASQHQMEIRALDLLLDSSKGQNAELGSENAELRHEWRRESQRYLEMDKKHRVAASRWVSERRVLSDECNGLHVRLSQMQTEVDEWQHKCKQSRKFKQMLAELQPQAAEWWRLQDAAKVEIKRLEQHLADAVASVAPLVTEKVELWKAQHVLQDSLKTATSLAQHNATLATHWEHKYVALQGQH